MALCLGFIDAVCNLVTELLKFLRGNPTFFSGFVTGGCVVLVMCAFARSVFKPTSVSSLEKVIKTLQKTIDQNSKDLRLKDIRINKCHEELQKAGEENRELQRRLNELKKQPEEGR